MFTPHAVKTWREECSCHGGSPLQTISTTRRALHFNRSLRDRRDRGVTVHTLKKEGCAPFIIISDGGVPYSALTMCKNSFERFSSEKSTILRLVLLYVILFQVYFHFTNIKTSLQIIFFIVPMSYLIDNSENTTRKVTN